MYQPFWKREFCNADGKFGIGEQKTPSKDVVTNVVAFSVSKILGKNHFLFWTFMRKWWLRAPLRYRGYMGKKGSIWSLLTPISLSYHFPETASTNDFLKSILSAVFQSQNIGLTSNASKYIHCSDQKSNLITNRVSNTHFDIILQSMRWPNRRNIEQLWTNVS